MVIVKATRRYCAHLSGASSTMKAKVPSLQDIIHSITKERAGPQLWLTSPHVMDKIEEIFRPTVDSGYKSQGIIIVPYADCFSNLHNYKLPLKE